MGRRTKLTPTSSGRILELLRGGNRRGVAARAAGVSEPTFYRWMADERLAYREFQEAVEHAEAEAEVAVVAVLRSAMPRNAGAAIWWLENRSPEWRRRREVPPPTNENEVQHKPPDPPAQVIVLTQEQMERIALERLREINPSLPADDDEDWADGLVETGPGVGKQ